MIEKTTFVGGVVALGGTIVSMFLGGWDAILQALIVFMVIDYVTGVAQAIKTKSLSSDVMFWGGIRKGITVIVIGMAVILDQLVGNEQPMFRTLALYFYIGREGLSILENLAILGVPLPNWIRTVLAKIADKGEEKQDDTK